jgi:NADPH2:quinone reductase
MSTSQSTMQAIQVKDPAGGPAGLDLIELPIPTLTNPRDILVKVHTVALNPGDTRLRQISASGAVPGLDGAGVVVAAGGEAKFVAGDEVMWGSSIVMGQNGSNAQYEIVDSRAAGRKPKNLSWEDAAAIPLVGLTVWEMLEEKFRIKPDVDNGKETLLVVNGAGGVGAMAIQLALKVMILCSHDRIALKQKQ